MSESIYEEEDIMLLAVDSMLELGLEIRKALKNTGYSCSLNNVRYKELVDAAALSEICDSHRLLVTIEENAAGGGYGEKIRDYAASFTPSVNILNISAHDEYVECGGVELLKQENIPDIDSIVKWIITAYIGLGKDCGR